MLEFQPGPPLDEGRAPQAKLSLSEQSGSISHGLEANQALFLGLQLLWPSTLTLGPGLDQEPDFETFLSDFDDQPCLGNLS